MSIAVTVGGLFAFAVVAATLLTRDPRIAMAGLAAVAAAALLGALVAAAAWIAGAR